MIAEENLLKTLNDFYHHLFAFRAAVSEGQGSITERRRSAKKLMNLAKSVWIWKDYKKEIKQYL